MDNTVKCNIGGRECVFNTLPMLFSPSAPDRGSMAMLRHVQISAQDKALDLGCGWGYVSAALCISGAGQVQACDVSADAVNVSNDNFARLGFKLRAILSDGLDEVQDRDFTLILSNPPYQSDFSVAAKFIKQSHSHLVPGGRLIMVTKRLDWYKNRIIAVFGGVHIDRDDGYFVFTAEKRIAPVKEKAEEKSHALSKKLRRKYERR